MHMRLNKVKLWTRGVQSRTILNLVQGCMSGVTGYNFLCMVRQLEIHFRATVGKSGGYSGEIILQLLPTRCLKFINNNVTVHHDVSTQTSPNPNGYCCIFFGDLIIIHQLVHIVLFLCLPLGITTEM